jgi:hypothetical protein
LITHDGSASPSAHFTNQRFPCFDDVSGEF